MNTAFADRSTLTNASELAILRSLVCNMATCFAPNDSNNFFNSFGSEGVCAGLICGGILGSAVGIITIVALGPPASAIRCFPKLSALDEDKPPPASRIVPDVGHQRTFDCAATRSIPQKTIKAT